MILTKLKVCAAAVLLGVIAAGTIVVAQQPKTERKEPSYLEYTEIPLPNAVAAKGGNFIVDWIPVTARTARSRSQSTRRGTPSTCRG
jgi:hypothetical protein